MPGRFGNTWWGIQLDFKNPDDNRFLQAFAAKHGIHFSRPGNGICHYLHVERDILLAGVILRQLREKGDRQPEAPERVSGEAER